MVKAVLFDIFGTLIENGTYSPTKTTQKLLRVRLPYPPFVTRFNEAFMSKRYATQKEAFEAVCAAFHKRVPDFVIEKLIGTWNKNKILAQPYDDTFAGLETLKELGITRVLFCNMDNFTYDFLRDKFELDKYFDVLAPSCETGKLKLGKDSFTPIFEQLGISAEDALMVGDSVHSDIKAAENAGVPAVLMDRKDTREFEPKVISMDQLIERVRSDE